jgi:hypothetical protein
VSGSGDWLQVHGDDMIPVRLVDLLCAVARMEQVSAEPAWPGSSSVTEERLYTCDLPRLREYLPAEALEVLADADEWQASGTAACSLVIYYSRPMTHEVHSVPMEPGAFLEVPVPPGHVIAKVQVCRPRSRES